MLNFYTAHVCFRVCFREILNLKGATHHGR